MLRRLRDADDQVDDDQAGRQRGRARRRPGRGAHGASSRTRSRHTCWRSSAPRASTPTSDLGASPRSAVALYRTAQAWAALAGRDFVLPDDVQHLVKPVLGASAGARPGPRAARRDAPGGARRRALPDPRSAGRLRRTSAPDASDERLDQHGGADHDLRCRHGLAADRVHRRRAAAHPPARRSLATARSRLARLRTLGLPSKHRRRRRGRTCASRSGTGAGCRSPGPDPTTRSRSTWPGTAARGRAVDRRPDAAVRARHAKGDGRCPCGAACTRLAPSACASPSTSGRTSPYIDVPDQPAIILARPLMVPIVGTSPQRAPLAQVRAQAQPVRRSDAVRRRAAVPGRRLAAHHPLASVGARGQAPVEALRAGTVAPAGPGARRPDRRGPVLDAQLRRGPVRGAVRRGAVAGAAIIVARRARSVSRRPASAHDAAHRVPAAARRSRSRSSASATCWRG